MGVAIRALCAVLLLELCAVHYAGLAVLKVEAYVARSSS